MQCAWQAVGCHDFHEWDDPAEDILGDNLAGDGLGFVFDEGVLKDVLADGDLVIVPAEDVFVGEPTEDGLGVVLDEEVLLDFLAEGDLVDFLRKMFLNPTPG